ncbi:sensor histidine kinase [Schumannella soli]|uniref:histidine kinase n=1 Tax=Schumannella soli TaxID=2590779 RepID=A0A506Y4N4_9MICO|nr:ATP-binding protein [Schumannella soli]TPW76530.1 PAS domain-containing protein [Schumannella soli]
MPAARTSDTRPPRAISIAARVFWVQLAAAVLIAGALLAVLAVDAQSSAERDAAETSLSVARTVAVDPRVRSEVDAPDATAQLEPYALELVTEAGVDFVTIMTPDGIRVTHPDQSQIGKPFQGTIGPALKGRELTETFTGTLGPSVRAVVPIERDGVVVGLVSAGVTTTNVGAIVAGRLPFVLGVAAAVVLVGAITALVVQRSLRRVTGRMGPAELRRMVGYYESVLHSVREGLVLSDREHRVVLYNDEAAELLGLPPAGTVALPASAAALGVGPAVATLIDEGRRAVEETHLDGATLLLVNQEPAEAAPGSPADAGGSVMTLRDQSRLQQLIGELDSTRGMRDALRAQAHEHANTVHTLVALLELGRVEQAIELASESTRTSQELADRMLATVDHPVLGALLLGKTAQANERGVELTVTAEPGAVPPLGASALVSVVGNLVDNAIDAALAAEAPRTVAVMLRRTGARPEPGAGADSGGAADGAAVGTGADAVELRVADSGRGIPADRLDAVFDLGVTSKSDPGGAHGNGLAVARAATEAAGGELRFEVDADGATASPTTAIASFPDGTRPASTAGSSA